jgi:hypothetical protein
MKKRMILMLAVAIAFIAAIGGVKFFQIRAGMAQHGSLRDPMERDKPAHAVGWSSRLKTQIDTAPEGS